MNFPGTHLFISPFTRTKTSRGSFERMRWFVTLPSCHALFGRFNSLPLAGTGRDKVPAFRAATRRLLALGHRRIVYIVDEARRKPTPGINARAFLEELTSHGISTGVYHLPDWEASPAGFYNLLERLFHFTPPTALIVDEAARYIAAAEYLARRARGKREEASPQRPERAPAGSWV